MTKEIEEALNDPELKKVSDALAAWDQREISAAELKAIVEKSPMSYTHISQRIIEMCEEEINKENNND